MRRYVIFGSIVTITVILYGMWLLFPDPDLLRLFQTLLSFTFVYGLFSLVLEQLMRRQIQEEKTNYTVRKVISILETVIILIIGIRIWVPDPGTLVISFGIIGAGVAIALQDIFKNFAGSVVIILNGTYAVGDRVEIDGNFGDVMDIGIMATTLMEIRNWVDGDQATGRITVVPNGKAITTPVHNYTKDHSFIWDELHLPITYNSNWRRAIDIALSIVKPEVAEITKRAEAEIERIGEKYYLPRRDIEPAVFVNLTDNWISLYIRYVTNVRERRVLRAKISRAILEAFEKDPEITISSETSTVTVVQGRGKEGDIKEREKTN